MISPTGADIGRMVKLPRFNAEPLFGELRSARRDDNLKTKTFEVVCAVLYEGDKVPISTDAAKLEWA